MSKTDDEVKATRDDREYLLRPHLWPEAAPAKCYVKRGQSPRGWLETGPCILWATDEYVVQSHHWAGPLAPAEHATHTARVNDLVTNVLYTSVDALLADGWIVD